jgi:hypothetical protein
MFNGIAPCKAGYLVQTSLHLDSQYFVAWDDDQDQGSCYFGKIMARWKYPMDFSLTS